MIIYRYIAYQVLIKLANQMVLFIISALGIVVLTMMFAFVHSDDGVLK